MTGAGCRSEAFGATVALRVVSTAGGGITDNASAMRKDCGALTGSIAAGAATGTGGEAAADAGAGAATGAGAAA